MESIDTARPKLAREGVIAASILAVLTLAWLLVSRSGFGSVPALIDNALHICAYAYLILLLPPILGKNGAVSVIAILAGLLVTILLIADLTSLRFFGSPFLTVYPYLPVTASNASIGSVAAYVTSYVPIGVALLALAAVSIGVGSASLVQKRDKARLIILIALPVLYLASLVPTATFAQPDAVIGELMSEPAKAQVVLTKSDRSGSLAPASAEGESPETIIVVVMESTGAAKKSSSEDMLLRDRIIRDSRADGWVSFSNAVTTSNATDIAVPSLLSGGGSHEPTRKVLALPLLWQLADARGYHTGFITSSTIRWARFDDFLSGSEADEFWTAANSELPFVNDLAVDDHYTYSKAAGILQEADGPLFLALYPQALHWPFQTDSQFEIPEEIQERRSRATFIAESGFRLLFDALRATGRMDDALIVIVGDHGEFDYDAKLRMPEMRLDTFEDGILSPMYLVKAPESVADAQKKALQENSGRLVASHDVAPTLADVLNVELANGLSYDGHSLFEEIPSDRAVYSIATNEWRHWFKSTLAVSRGSQRMICDEKRLCRLFSANGVQLTLDRDAETDDELFEAAMSEDIPRAALSQIFRNYYR